MSNSDQKSSIFNNPVLISKLEDLKGVKENIDQKLLDATENVQRGLSHIPRNGICISSSDVINNKSGEEKKITISVESSAPSSRRASVSYINYSKSEHSSPSSVPSITPSPRSNLENSGAPSVASSARSSVDSWGLNNPNNKRESDISLSALLVTPSDEAIVH
jgi:hypothetical protein